MKRALASLLAGITIATAIPAIGHVNIPEQTQTAPIQTVLDCETWTGDAWYSFSPRGGTNATYQFDTSANKVTVRPAFDPEKFATYRMELGTEGFLIGDCIDANWEIPTFKAKSYRLEYIDGDEFGNHCWILTNPNTDSCIIGAQR